MGRLTPLQLVSAAEHMKRGARHPDVLKICDAIFNTDMGAPAECPECAKVKAAEAKRKAENAARVSAWRVRDKARRAGNG